MISFVIPFLACGWISRVEFLFIFLGFILIIAHISLLQEDVGQNIHLGKVVDFASTFKDKVCAEYSFSTYLLNHIFKLEVYWNGS